MSERPWIHVEVKRLDLVAMWLAIGAFLFGLTQCATRMHEADTRVRIERLKAGGPS